MKAGEGAPPPEEAPCDFSPRCFYAEKLSGERLRECYEIASPRVRRYLQAEIAHVLGRIRPNDIVLELGCGYGRVAFELAGVAGRVVGIDIAADSVLLARRMAGPRSRCEFHEMDATQMTFPDDQFDVVVCIQNGICAFGVEKVLLLREAVRVVRPGGRVLFSSYAEKFWPHRLKWFELQAERKLIGEIDYESTRDGVIVCKDGFRVGMMGEDDFRELCSQMKLTPVITHVDGSSTFCELVVPGAT
jgi:2-polyprenyl-6-hydroxyphenyl methylase/3-demethylubiquinone-9 3-methyltransferase